MTVPNPVEVKQNLPELLSAATVAHRDAQETASVTARRWKELIVEAIDAGARVRDVAELARVSPSRIHAVILSVCSRP